MNVSRNYRSVLRKAVILTGLLVFMHSAAEAQLRESQLFVSNPFESDEVVEESFTNEPFTPEMRSPGGALLRSAVLPGWGQYYADKSSWRRGQFHLAADLMLASTLIYLYTNASMLENNMFAHANAYAGIDLRTVPRNVEIAVSGSNSLDDYNESQLRTRNWDRLIEDRPEYRWNWESDTRRGEYVRLRDRRDRAEQQIPAVISIMVVNRVISGVHAFIVAQNQNEMLQSTQIGLHLPEMTGGRGVAATVYFRF